MDNMLDNMLTIEAMIQKATAEKTRLVAKEAAGAMERAGADTSDVLAACSMLLAYLLSEQVKPASRPVIVASILAVFCEYGKLEDEQVDQVDEIHEAHKNAN